jgi:ferric-dicitrate binding protein FerR (iron transport regulator)
LNEHTNTTGSEPDADLAALLRAVGPRVQPPSAMAVEVRAAVAAEWRAMTARRVRRRLATTWSLAAGVAVAAVGVWLARPLYVPAGEPVASLARIEGTVEYRGEHARDWAQLPANAELREGDELRTGATGRAALKLANGIQLRLDVDTRVAFNDAEHARLRRGGVYVDSGVTGADPSRDLEIDTPAGSVRHLGTQYEARVADGVLRVGVREGLVAVGARGGDIVANAGEQLLIQDGQVTRNALAANADAWAWVGSITPPFAIEGRSVDDFLTWAGRETGRQIVYTSSEAAQRARAIVLKGSVSGLTPDDAVSAVLSTTALRPAIDDGHIRIDAANP